MSDVQDVQDVQDVLAVSSVAAVRCPHQLGVGLLFDEFQQEFAVPALMNFVSTAKNSNRRRTCIIFTVDTKTTILLCTKCRQ
jgi:hypothetical protein